MKVAILILYTKSWQPLADIVIPNVEAYSAKHKYQFSIRKYPEPYTSDFGFNKLIEIKKLFDEGIGVVWSLDLDCLITNHSVKIEDFLDEEHFAYFTNDYNWINCGSFVIKKSDWSTMFIDAVLNFSKHDPNLYCEQDGIGHYLKVTPNETKVKFLPQNTINSYKYELYPEIPPQTHEQGNWEEGDFVLHLPGIGMDKRIEIFKQTKITL